MVAKGAYVVSPAKNETPEGILIATGSEVNLAVQALRASPNITSFNISNNNIMGLQAWLDLSEAVVDANEKLNHPCIRIESPRNGRKIKKYLPPLRR